ncbi:MAG: hypothetical protein JNK63_08435 [Chthonomonas sp.]|nr:hypothetical protein [Chthonomonas sp.]
MTAALLASLLQASGLPNVWMMEHSPGGTYHGYYVDFNKRTKTVKWVWKFERRSGSLEGVGSRGEFYKGWADQAPKQSDIRTFQVYSATKNLLYSVKIPSAYGLGPAKPTVSDWVSGEKLPFAFAGYREAKTPDERVSIQVLDSQRRWHSYPGASLWTYGRTRDEIFVAKLKWASIFRASKLEKAWIVSRKTGLGKPVNPIEFRKLLWPAARIAYDRWGSFFFFMNPVADPGYPSDPAYVITSLFPYTDTENVDAGKSAIVFPSGKVVIKPYHGTPLIAAKKVGRTMYVLTDDSYYNKVGWTEKDVLHLMKVDAKQGLSRIVSVPAPKGRSYAFAE